MIKSTDSNKYCIVGTSRLSGLREDITGPISHNTAVRTLALYKAITQPASRPYLRPAIAIWPYKTRKTK